jgi:integrase
MIYSISERGVEIFRVMPFRGSSCPDGSPDAFIFANAHGGFCCSSNYRNRVLRAVAEELELPNLTFQIIRRSIATLAQKKGTVKDVQGLLRHSRAATTTDIYMQEIPEGVQATVDSTNQELRRKVRVKPSRKEGGEKFATKCYQTTWSGSL